MAELNPLRMTSSEFCKRIKDGHYADGRQEKECLVVHGYSLYDGLEQRIYEFDKGTEVEEIRCYFQKLYAQHGSYNWDDVEIFPINFRIANEYSIKPKSLNG